MQRLGGTVIVIFAGGILCRSVAIVVELYTAPKEVNRDLLGSCLPKYRRHSIPR